MPMKRISQTQTDNSSEREKAVAWVNVSLINSKGKKLQMPVGIPLLGSSDDPLIQALLDRGEHGQTSQGELRLSFVGETSSQEIEL